MIKRPGRETLIPKQESKKCLARFKQLTPRNE